MEREERKASAPCCAASPEMEVDNNLPLPSECNQSFWIRSVSLLPPPMDSLSESTTVGVRRPFFSRTTLRKR